MHTWMDSVVRSFQDAGLMALVVDAGVESLLILSVASAICLAWRRGPAASRHLVWCLALAGCLLVPAISQLLPAAPRPLWVLHSHTDSANELTLTLELTPRPHDRATVAPNPDLPKAEPRAATAATAGHAGQSWSARLRAGWADAALAVWATGVVLILGWVALGRWALLGMHQRAYAPADPEWGTLLTSLCAQLHLRRRVVLLQSNTPVMPVTWGWWRPVILLPVATDTWPAQQRRVVLLHELAHVQRWDCLTQLLGRCVCALYWFNPLVWVAVRQICLERERACDDLVLEGGCKASDYAAHLLEIARNFQPVPQVAAIAMARSARLKTRIEAIVDGSRRRHGPSARLLTLSAMAVLGLLAAVAAPQTPKAADTSTGWKSWWDARLRAFFAEKAVQARQLMEGKTVAPEVWPYFEAGTRGDWTTTTNLYVSMRERAHQYAGTNTDERLDYCWSPIIETRLAWENLAYWTRKYVLAYGNDIIRSIPQGSIYFGGTDPGRGVITVLCKSQVQADPFFTLTQNALADGTYLYYLRAMYGSRLYIPTDEDFKKCFDAYMADARQRLDKHQLRPGEDVTVKDGKVSASGQIAVMSINGLITKVIFDHNTNREFYVEESFPLDWMYPHLSPHGLIMKINREALVSLSEEIVQQDHDYWGRYTSGMLGNGLTYDTSVADLAKFVDKIYVQHNLRGFRGDAEFLRDDFAQKAYSKLRSSIGGLYAWRAGNAKTPEEKQRMTNEAEFAFRQAFALCPYSPEALFRYVNLLAGSNRIDDAILLTETCLKVVPPDPTVHGLVPPEIIRTMGPQDAPIKGLLQNLKQFKNQKKPDGSTSAK